jgi:hypothetical protein
MEHLHMTLRLYIERLVHRGTIHKDRDITIQHIDFLLSICHHSSGSPDARQTDDDAADQEQSADNHYQLDFVFEILYYHILSNLH